MNKRIPLGIAIALLVVTVAATYSVTMMIAMKNFNSLVSDLPERTSMYRSLDELDQLARKNYLEEIDEQFLSDSLLNGYVDGLADDFSYYLSQQELTEYQRNLEGTGSGLGIRMMNDPHPETGNIYVVKVYAGGPAETAGLQNGDQITEIDGRTVENLGFEAAVNSLSGTEGTSVALTLLRGTETVQATVIRGSYEVESVTYEKKGDIGYIQLVDFKENTLKQFEKAITDLQNSQVKSLIFDVRNNSSDYLKGAADILDILVPTGTIMFAQYKDGTKEALYTSDANDVTLPMIVLTNENTSGAAELFACDLRDFGKAKLVGTQTFGKGVMQKLYTLADGGAVNLTIAEYLPYKSVNFDKVGLTPDYLVTMTETDAKYLPLIATKSDAQYDRAVELLNTTETTAQ